MSDLQKTIDNQKEEHWSESSEDEDFEADNQNINQTMDFFSGITSSTKTNKKSKQTESNDNINKKITDQVLKETKLELKTQTTSTNDKIQNLKQKKKHKLSLQQESEEEIEDQKQKQDNEHEQQTILKKDQKTWNDLNLGKPLLKAIDDLEYHYPTKIQEISIPAIISGKDILASSLTGSGKTGAFLIPLIQRLYRSQTQNYSKVLIVLPTRELAFQCYEMFQNLNKYTKLNACLIIGQSSMHKQEAELRRYPEFIIATPGRLIDHIQNSQSFDLDNLEVLIFDEADKLLDLGFSAEVTKIAKESNKDRQTLLFSATLNQDVNKLINLALKKPIKLHANPDSTTSDKLDQFVLKVANEEQREACLLGLVTRFYKTQTLIFFKTKKQCHKMAIIFGLLGLKVCELHGNLSQQQRIKAFEDYKNGEYDYLMATDLASRGLDIKELKAVINFEIPQEVTRYIHRVGRTARAGKKGVCVTICTEHDILKLKKMMKKNRDKLQKVYLEDNVIRQFQQKIKGLEEDIKSIILEEVAEKNIRKAEMEAQKAQNLIDHKDEIMNRPKKEWFQSYKEKNQNKKIAKDALDQEDFEDREDQYEKNFNMEQQKSNTNQYQNQNQNSSKKFNQNNSKINQKRKFNSIQKDETNNSQKKDKNNNIQKQKFQNPKKNQQSKFNNNQNNNKFKKQKK